MKVSWFRVTMLLRKHGVTVLLVAQSFVMVTLVCFLHQSDVILCRYHKATLSSKAMALMGKQKSVTKQPTDYTGNSQGNKIRLRNTAGKEIIVPFENIENNFNFEQKVKSVEGEFQEEKEDVYISAEHKDSFQDNQQQREGSEEGAPTTDEEDEEDEERIIEQPLQEENKPNEEPVIDQPVQEDQSVVEEQREESQQMVPAMEVPQEEANVIDNQGVLIQENDVIPMDKQRENQENEAYIENYPKDFIKVLSNIQLIEEKEPASQEQISEGNQIQQQQYDAQEAPPEQAPENNQVEQQYNDAPEAPLEQISEDNQVQQQYNDAPEAPLEQIPEDNQAQQQYNDAPEAPLEQIPENNQVQQQYNDAPEAPLEQIHEDNQVQQQQQEQQEAIEIQPVDVPVVNEELSDTGQVQRNTDDSQEQLSEQQSLPSLYQVYSQSGVNSGLTYEGSQFLLNGLPFRILSGAIHYFRVHQDYWKDRLRKLRAAGLNTVETYVAWNIHEPDPGKFNFVSEEKNIRKFIALAKEEDLFVILRPGPYICAEWEFGGIPSWILRNDSVKVRSMNSAYLTPALIYIREFAQKVKNLQWSKEYGPQPIIGFQVENEYPIFPETADVGRKYIMTLKKEMEDYGLNQAMFFVSNPIRQVTPHALFDDVLQTINFGNLPIDRLKELKSLQPNKPLMVMEFWTGWFDNWLEPHKKFEVYMFKKNLQGILMANASLNLYMFHGGTNFGYMNGAYIKKDKVSYRPVVSSYDYDAILSESGSYTSKYYALKTMIEQYPFGVKTFTPEPPKEKQRVAYLPAHIRYYFPLKDILQILSDSHEASFHVSSPVPMEMLEKVGLGPQKYGFILYQKKSVYLRPNNVLKIKGFVKDILYILINGKLVTKPLTPQDLGTYPPYFDLKDPQINIEGPGEACQLDLLVENMGRMNVGGIHQERKGITGRVILNNVLLTDWAVFPLELQHSMFPPDDKWLPFPPPNDVTIDAPALYKAALDVPEDAVCDTFINLSQDNWIKGQIFVNTFNLGRYWNLGPTKTSYVPAPILHEGKNQIYIFEIFEPGRTIQFDDHPTLG